MADNSDDTSLGSQSGEIDTFSGQYHRRADLRPALVFLRGELLAVQIPLDREQVTLRRALDADIRINDSRHRGCTPALRLSAMKQAARCATDRAILIPPMARLYMALPPNPPFV